MTMTSFVSLGCSLCLLLGCSLSVGLEVKVGSDVTLMCVYNAGYYGKLSTCWGRGPIPNRGCANQLIQTDGTTVTSRLSERYLLMGNLGEGDVSLTIRQVEESDTGIYGCRVDVPGWFNDRKHQITLTVVPARPDALMVKMQEVGTRSLTVRWSHVFDGGRPITSYRIDIKSEDDLWDAAVTTEVSNPDLTRVTLVDLQPARNYNLRMFAINSVGMSEPSNVLKVTTKEAAPDGPPLDMQFLALSSTSIRVTWKPPSADLRNGVLQSYSISYTEYDPASRQLKKWQNQRVGATREQESLILSGLKPSTKYGVIIQALTNAGIGPASTLPFISTLDEVVQTSTQATINTPFTVIWSIEDTTRLIPDHTTSVTDVVRASTTWEQSSTSFSSESPDPPVVELKEVRDNAVSLTWTAGFEGGGPITGYFLEYKAVNGSWDFKKTVVDFSPNQTEATIIEINPSMYNIRMFATNSHGTSKASNILTFTTGEKDPQKGAVATATSIDTQAATSTVDEARSGHLVAIVIPVVLVMLFIVAIVTVWQLRRLKGKKGNLNMWLSNDAILYRSSDSTQEL
ncbi:cell adhesion molecule DSCAML1-like isoform X2 [Entelurus aequoreus]|uniref:cell adhesion molecule DSCAML1-like isoform X2 n=1 Tax=Entelurus aequoreus TaxID=161455 RepID=UPI002B1D5D5C|nr:cell adhesion molecule DSCAML1-like isoform X2 [Entelurus aequoreus]